MVEIFTRVNGQDGEGTRILGTDIRLNAPSDVHFGSAVPGIAYYEKSGADLRVTLLNGQEIMIRDFFVIGAAGEYSRLRDGGAAGGIEVTGLIAPEPFVPQDGTTQSVVVSDPATPPASTASSPALAEIPVTVEVMEPGDARVSAEPGASPAGAGNVGQFSGLPGDGLVFGIAMMPSLAMVFKGGDEPPAPILRMARSSNQRGPAEQPADEPADEQGAGPSMDPALAALLNAAFDAEQDPAPGNDAPALGGFDPGSSGFDSFAPGNGPFSALFDGTFQLPVEG